MKVDELYDRLVTKYGRGNQIDVAMGELGELINELSKMNRNGGNAQHTCEEIADAEICIAQVKRMIPGSREMVAMYKRYKLSRLQLLYFEGDSK